jgi:hypothetical protein
MDAREELTELFYHQISEVCQVVGMTEPQQRSASRELVEAAISFLRPSKEHLMAAEMREGELVQVVHYDLAAAVGFLTSLVSGIIGTGTSVSLACAVIGCLTSLKGLKKLTSRAEGILFWAVYESHYHIASRKQAKERFKELCEIDDSVNPEDFSAALQGLLDVGCIKESDGNLIVAEQVIVH